MTEVTTCRCQGIIPVGSNCLCGKYHYDHCGKEFPAREYNNFEQKSNLPLTSVDETIIIRSKLKEPPFSHQSRSHPPSERHVRVTFTDTLTGEKIEVEALVLGWEWHSDPYVRVHRSGGDLAILTDDGYLLKFRQILRVPHVT